MRLRLRHWLLVSHLVALSLPILALLGTGALAWDLKMQTKAELINQGSLLGLLVQAELDHARALDPDAGVDQVADRLQPKVVQARQDTLAAVRVLDPSGVAVASSGDGVGQDYSDLPEVQDALAGTLGTQMRPRDQKERAPLSSPSRGAGVRVFQTVPVLRNERLVAVVLLSRTPREELQVLYQMSPRLAWGWLLALVLTVVIALRAATLGSRSLQKLADASRGIADGDVGAVDRLVQVQDSHVVEVGDVARSVTVMTRQLQARLDYISEFAGNVSHEFKTPIATLRGTVELLQDDAAMPPEQRLRFLVNAHEELDRLERLVSGLLRLARAEQLSERGVVDLDALGASLAERAGLAWSPGAGRALGSAPQLEAALQNLVDNALAHRDEHARVQGVRDGARVGVAVTNDGPGISPANVERVFERFFTTRRKSGGTGLGLPLVRTIARAHGGTVELASEPGSTRVVLWLPRLETER